MRLRFLTLGVTGALALSLAACAGAPASPPPASDGAPGSATTGDGHGAIAGAAEMPEPQLGLTAIDADGAVTHLDLLDETVTAVGEIDPPTALTSDGRYLFAQTANGVEVVDSGVWTWDHVDHFHYYRAQPRLLGTVEGEGPATVATTNSSTTGGTGVFFGGSGEAVLLDTEALSKGELVERFRVSVAPHFGMVVPVGSSALVTEPAGGGGADAAAATTGESTAAASVRLYNADGVPGESVACPDARGTVTTRVGAVIGCSDAALLATLDGDHVDIERVAYPADATAPPATSFANREGRPTVAALAGDAAVWLLDTRTREWTLVPAPAPLVQVTAVDDDAGHVLALAADGRMVVLDGATGAQLAATEPLVAGSLRAGSTPVLIADQQRAYLSAPTEQRLYEIDFADDARIARTFETAIPPTFVAETGR